MTSIAERKRRKRAAKISLSGGKAVEQRAPTHPRREKQKDPMHTVAVARMRHTGITNAKDATQPVCGTDLGLCIRHLTAGDEFIALSNAWEAISASHRNYRALYIGQTGNPKGATIAMVPDRIEANQSLRVDLRTPDEKVAAAKASWAGLVGKIDALPVPQMRWALRGALEGFLGEDRLWRDATPTPTGRAALAALRAILAGAK